MISNRYSKSVASSDSHDFEFKLVPFVLMLIASGLIGWAVSTISPQGSEWLSGIACGVATALTLGVCVSATTERKGIMIKTCGVVFFIGCLIANIILAAINATYKTYIITDGLLLTLFGTIIYTLHTRQVA